MDGFFPAAMTHLWLHHRICYQRLADLRVCFLLCPTHCCTKYQHYATGLKAQAGDIVANSKCAKNLIRESETSSKSHFLRKKFQDFESCWQVTSHTADFPKFPDYSVYSEVNLQKKVLIILRNIRTFVVGSLKKQIRPLLQFFPKILQLCFSTAKS